MKKYDPDRPVDPEQWLALDDGERLDMILKYHQRAEDPLPNPHIHAHFHAIVETQVALGDEIPVRATLERLMAEGLDRHDAIHAIGSVLAGHIYDLLHGEGTTEKDPNPAYFAALEELTAESWLSQADEDDDEELELDEEDEELDFGEEEEDDEEYDFDEEDEEDEDDPEEDKDDF